MAAPGVGHECGECWQLVSELALPALIVAVGVGCSVAGLYVAVVDILGQL